MFVVKGSTSQRRKAPEEPSCGFCFGQSPPRTRTSGRVTVALCTCVYLIVSRDHVFHCHEQQQQRLDTRGRTTQRSSVEMYVSPGRRGGLLEVNVLTLACPKFCAAFLFLERVLVWHRCRALDDTVAFCHDILSHTQSCDGRAADWTACRSQCIIFCLAHLRVDGLHGTDLCIKSAFIRPFSPFIVAV